MFVNSEKISNFSLKVRKQRFTRYMTKIPYEEALGNFKEIAKQICSDFTIDKENNSAIEQLIKYTIAHEDFKGNLYKGLLLMGRKGTGKTISMMILQKLMEYYNFHHLLTLPVNKLSFQLIRTRKIVAEYEDEEKGGKKALSKYHSQTIKCFDDLGEEMKDGNLASHFGKDLNIMEYIINERYENFLKFGTLTHATTNYKFKHDDKQFFLDFYGERAEDRMKEMFNIIIFKGNSRRPEPKVLN